MIVQRRNARLRVAEFGLMFASALFMLLLAEVGYRMFLAGNTVLSYNVANKALYRFDDHTGFTYAPELTAVIANVRRGIPTVYGKVETGPYGNLGNGVTSWSDDDYKVMVFGDSFTAYPYSNHSWADHIALRMKIDVKKDLQVMNMARDGFGVLQIFSAAAHAVSSHNAEMVIIALIADDMDRARTWRTSLLIEGQERVLMSTTSADPPPDDLSQDVVLVHDAVSLEWCRTITAKGRAGGDTLVNRLNRQYRKLVPSNLRRTLWSLKVSYLFNRLTTGDPFHELRYIEHIPRVDISDYRHDGEFMNHLAMLNESGTPYYVVLLPTYEDVVNRDYIFTGRQQKLFESLESVLQRRVMRLLDFLDLDGMKAEDLYLLPVDHHPSEVGARVFANAIAKALRESGTANNTPILAGGVKESSADEVELAE